MRYRIVISLIILAGSIFSASTPVRAADCPTNWPLNFKNEPLRSEPAETTGLLQSYRNSIGNNMAIEFRKEFSNDKEKWLPYTWPMKWPDGEIWKNGANLATHYLYPGFIRDIVKIEVKSCPTPAIFSSNEISVTSVISKKYTFDDLFIQGNFKQQEIQLSEALKLFEKSISTYAKTGKIEDRYPTDDSIFFISPKIPGCLTYTGGLPAFWVSKGKICEIYVYSSALKEGRAKNLDLDNISLDKNSTGNPRVMFVIQETTLTPPKNSKQTINCVKGKTTKKISGTNPKCPKGYTKV